MSPRLHSGGVREAHIPRAFYGVLQAYQLAIPAPSIQSSRYPIDTSAASFYAAAIDFIWIGFDLRMQETPEDSGANDGARPLSPEGSRKE
jgi:hypothetical protein